MIQPPTDDAAAQGGDPRPSPPEGFWEQTYELLRRERELWDDGIDAPEWWPTSSPEAD